MGKEHCDFLKIQTERFYQMPVNPTEAQSDASRQNGKLSEGPVTPEGKAASSANSVKHGLFAKNTVLLKDEDPAEYETFCQQIRDNYIANSEFQVMLVQQLCNTQWRMQRCELREREASDAGDLETAEFWIRNFARMQRIQNSQLREINRFHKENKKRRDTDFEQACTIQRWLTLNNKCCDFSKLGFDFDIEEMNVFINRQTLWLKADQAIWPRK